MNETFIIAGAVAASGIVLAFIVGHKRRVGITITHTISQVHDRFNALRPDDTTGVIVALTGRIVYLRGSGNLCFATLESEDGASIRVIVSRAEVGDYSFEKWRENITPNNHVIVKGEVISSRSGDLSIMVTKWRELAQLLPGISGRVNK